MVTILLIAPTTPPFAPACAASAYGGSALRPLYSGIPTLLRVSATANSAFKCCTVDVPRLGRCPLVFPAPSLRVLSAPGGTFSSMSTSASMSPSTPASAPHIARAPSLLLPKKCHRALFVRTMPATSGSPPPQSQLYICSSLRLSAPTPRFMMRTPHPRRPPRLLAPPRLPLAHLLSFRRRLLRVPLRHPPSFICDTPSLVLADPPLTLACSFLRHPLALLHEPHLRRSDADAQHSAIRCPPRPPPLTRLDARLRLTSAGPLPRPAHPRSFRRRRTVSSGADSI
ncbi:hypothetical protein R3P38DRAFT_3178518 [Favolaschia claudopus]|uniref:Uncharacterized protein n=1 Tax=Favolaschia claudopus TaxID=2862362 RepID=A0AAW0CWR8_9AGAR